MDKKSIITEIINNWDEATYICAWNEYCDNINATEDRIEDMDSLDDLLSGLTPSEVINAIDSDFSLTDDYFKDGIYGITSGCDARDMSYPEDLIDAITDDTAAYSEYLTDADFREVVAEILGDEYEAFEAWFEDEYGGEMTDHEIEDLWEEYKGNEK